MRRKRKNKRQHAQKMTDAELRRAWDFLEGDEVYLIDYQENGIIGGIKLSSRKAFLIYQVLCNDGNGGLKTVQVLGSKMRLIKHADE